MNRVIVSVGWAVVITLSWVCCRVAIKADGDGLDPTLPQWSLDVQSALGWDIVECDVDSKSWNAENS